MGFEVTMDLNLNNVILHPIMTEKSTELKDNYNRYIFKVHPKANKIMIKQACEQLFNVKVEKVAIMNMMGKKKRTRWLYGKRPDWKKAIVKLSSDSKFDFFEGV